MRRALFALWLLVALVGLFVIGHWIYPPVGHMGSPSFLLVAALWVVGVVPISFTAWFKAEHQREQAVVDAALKSWRDAAPGSGALIAQAIELALSEEDEDSLKQLLATLSTNTPTALQATLPPFTKAATEWMSDDGGHSSREEHLESTRKAAQPLLPLLLSARP